MGLPTRPTKRRPRRGGEITRREHATTRGTDRAKRDDHGTPPKPTSGPPTGGTRRARKRLGRRAPGFKPGASAKLDGGTVVGAVGGRSPAMRVVRPWRPIGGPASYRLARAPRGGLPNDGREAPTFAVSLVSSPGRKPRRFPVRCVPSRPPVGLMTCVCEVARRGGWCGTKAVFGGTAEAGRGLSWLGLAGGAVRGRCSLDPEGATARCP